MPRWYANLHSKADTYVQTVCVPKQTDCLVHMYLLSNEGLHTNEAFATAVVLLVFVMLINMLANFVARRLSAKNAEND